MFRFRYAAVLTARGHAEDAAQRAFGHALGVERLARAYYEEQYERVQARAGQPAKPTAAMLVLAEHYRRRLQAALLVAAYAHDHARCGVEKAHRLLIQAQHAREALDRLAARDRARYDRRREQSETRELDELNAMQHWCGR